MSQDLVKEDRLALAGGRLIFSELAVQIVAYAVDRQVVRVVVAGSSAALKVEFESTVARGNRWTHKLIGDPPEDAVLEQLREIGYTAEEARAMVTLCGTRLRLLKDPLTRGPATCPAAEFMNQVEAAATGEITGIFERLVPTDRVTLSSVLDAIWSRSLAAPLARSGGDRKQIYPPKLADLPQSCFLVRPRNGDSLQRPNPGLDVSSVLYMDLSHQLAFQSVLHRNVWSKKKREIISGRS